MAMAFDPLSWVRTFVVVGSGPSLSKQDCDLIASVRDDLGLFVIAVNDSYRLLGDAADAIYACDYPWWRYHCQAHTRTGQPGILKLCPRAKRYSGEPMARADFGCELVEMRAGMGIAPSGSGYVMRGHGSGFQATGLAIKMGAKRIVLLGMDCKRSADGATHFFGDHPIELPNPQPFSVWAEEFDSLAEPAVDAGVEIINCTRDTAISKLQRADILTALLSSVYAGNDLSG